MQVTGSFPPMPCGVGDNTFELVRHLAARGHNVHVITSKKAEDNQPHPNVKIYPVMPGWSYFYGGRLLKTIRNLEPDVIHLQYPTKGYGRGFAPSILGMQLHAKKSPAPYIVTLHEFAHAHPLRKAAVMPLLTEATLIIFPSIQEREALHTRFDSLKRIPARIIPIGAVLPDNYEDIKTRIAENRSELMERWGVPKDGIIVNYGYLQRHKGFEILLAAFKTILEAGYQCELWHVGDFNPFKRSYDRFIQFISNQGILKDKVKFWGFLPLESACEIFGISRVGVFPFTDGYSERRSSMITFAHFDAPMITTYSKSGEINDKIKNHLTLVEPNEIEQLEKKLEEIIANDASYEYEKEMAAGFKKLYDWEMIAEKTESVYAELLDQRPIGKPEEQERLDLEVDSLSENMKKWEEKHGKKK